MASLECTDIEGYKSRKQKMLKTEVESNRYEETTKPITVNDRQETLPSPSMQDPPSECIEIAGEGRSLQNVVTAETAISQEKVKTTTNQDNCEFNDTDKSNNHLQNAVTAEANLVQNQDLVKPTAVREVKEAFPGCAKRESLEYTDIERQKDCAPNTVAAGDDLNHYEKTNTTTEHDRKESPKKENEQDELFDVEGFECYKPNTGKPGIHLNRFQEAKKVLSKIVLNPFLKEGKQSKSSAGVKPDQSSMPGKYNTNVRSGFSSYDVESQHREGLKKVAGASVVTLQDLVVPTPFEQCRSFRMKLKNKAKDKSETEAIEEAKACIEDIFQNSEAELDLVEDSEQEAMERNEKQLDDIFDEIERRIRLLRADVIRKFRTLTPKQKMEVLKFWEGAEEFFNILLEWINKMFIKVLENIRQGSIIEKDALKKIFEEVSGFLRSIFRE